MRKYINISLVLGLVTASFSSQAQDTEAHKHALVAGYKAAFTCSGTFNAGKTVESINAYELNRIYASYRPILAKLPAAVINKDAKYVSVKYSDAMPPRISAWRPHLGCSQLPIGATVHDIKHLPRANPAPRATTTDVKFWPYGDAFNKKGRDQKLATLINTAFDKKTYGDGTETTAIIVTTPTEMLGEKYIKGNTAYTSQRTWSVAKSIAASVLGVAVKEGIIDTSAPANIPEWQSSGDPRGKITLQNLLNMSSGLYSGKKGSRTDQLYTGGARVTDRSTRAPLDAMPGKRWRYANNDTLLVVRSLRAAIGDDAKYLAYPFEKLLHKIGMNNTALETDWEGNFIMSSQVWTTARDLARLGILYLNDGAWKDEQILPKGWGDYVRTPAPVQPPLIGKDGKPDWGYGAQFWLLDERFDLPNDTYVAAGHRGQYIVIIPSKDLVIIRRGYDESGGIGFDIATFTRHVLATVK